jgi:predicted aspartyl protease
MVIDNREEVDGIIDLGSQIIAMLEAVCHNIGLEYNPSIKLNMQSANGEVD